MREGILEKGADTPSLIAPYMGGANWHHGEENGRVKVQVGINNSGRWAGFADADHVLSNDQSPNPQATKLVPLLGFVCLCPRWIFFRVLLSGDIRSSNQKGCDGFSRR